eukprot:jgi/Chrzof1/9477/Cz04g04160.t1
MSADQHGFVEDLHYLLCWLMIVSGAAAFVALLRITGPYGRYSREGWGWPINAKLAWMTQELPALLVPLVMVITNWDTYKSNLTTPRTIFTAAFLIHYSYRSLIYPLLIRGGKKTPFSVWFLAVLFCLWNGFLQVSSIKM